MPDCGWAIWRREDKEQHADAVERRRRHQGAPQPVGAGKGRGITKPPHRRRRGRR